MKNKKSKLNIISICLFIIILLMNSCVNVTTKNDDATNAPMEESVDTEEKVEEPIETDEDLILINKIRDEYNLLQYEKIATLSQTCFRPKKTDKYVYDKSHGPINTVVIDKDDKKRKGKLSLSFDCAYAGDYIIPILDALDAYNVKASFFATMGFIKEHPDYVIEIVNRGHDFGSHTANHLHLNEADDETVIRELMECEVYVKKTFGFDMCLFRHPYGEFNERNTELVNKMGYYPINWAFDSFDWKNEGAMQIVERINSSKFYQGNIMLFHASGIYTAETLPSIIQYIRALGLDFVKITDLIYQQDFEVVKGKQTKKIVEENDVNQDPVAYKNDIVQYKKEIVINAKDDPENDKNIDSIFKNGNSIKLGKWNMTNKSMDSINYEVIDSDDETITLMSQDTFEAIPYDYDILINWNKSYIRKWLNEYFYEKSFSDIEKEIIVSTFDGKENTYDLVSIPGIDDYDNDVFKECLKTGAKLSSKLLLEYKQRKDLYYNPINYMWLKDRFYITRSTPHIYKYEYMTKEVKDVKLSFRPIIKVDKKALIKNYADILADERREIDLSDYDSFLDDNYNKGAEKYYNDKLGLIENKKDQKVIYLTFDDGPSAKTESVLDILKEEGIKASFFLCKYDKSGKKYIKRMIDEGHTVCLHGMIHDYDVIYADEESFFENTESIQSKLYDDFGIKPMYLRFPGGSSNTVSKKSSNVENIMTKLIKDMSDKGYRYFDWSVSSGDAEVPAKSAIELYQNVLSSVKEDDENVILMHDSNSHQATVDALKATIEKLKEDGYIFKQISDDTIPYHHMIDN